MRGWLSLAQNILQPSPPPLPPPLSSSRENATLRSCPYPGHCGLRKRRRRREVDRYDPELIRIAQRRRRGQLGERPERKESSTRVWLGLRLLPPRPTAARPFCSGHVDKQSVRRARDLFFSLSPPPSLLPSKHCAKIGDHRPIDNLIANYRTALR